MATLKKISILTLFPEVVNAYLNSSILRRSQLRQNLELRAIDLKEYGFGKHRKVDDVPYGGNSGMLLRYDVLDAAMKKLSEAYTQRSAFRLLLTSPRGLLLDQSLMQVWAQKIQSDEKEDPSHAEELQEIFILCGRYEGVDERFVEEWVDLELSLGDYILTGGEICALAFVDAVVRLIPGVLGSSESLHEESFSNGLLEYPQFTRPREFKGEAVPSVLSSGHHGEISKWNENQSLMLSFAFKPKLIDGHSGENLSDSGQELLKLLKKRLKRRNFNI